MTPAKTEEHGMEGWSSSKQEEEEFLRLGVKLGEGMQTQPPSPAPVHK